jgi:hypothetical protein
MWGQFKNATAVAGVTLDFNETLNRRAEPKFL